MISVTLATLVLMTATSFGVVSLPANLSGAGGGNPKGLHYMLRSHKGNSSTPTLPLTIPRFLPMLPSAEPLRRGTMYLDEADQPLYDPTGRPGSGGLP